MERKKSAGISTGTGAGKGFLHYVEGAFSC